MLKKDVLKKEDLFVYLLLWKDGQMNEENVSEEETNDVLVKDAVVTADFACCNNIT
ncbi:MAG: hypothetical protein ABID79_01640 [Elusimicrobiota bacterium]